MWLALFLSLLAGPGADALKTCTNVNYQKLIWEYVSGKPLSPLEVPQTRTLGPNPRI